MGFVSLCTPLESGGAVHSEIHQVNKKSGNWAASWPTEGGTPGNYPLTSSDNGAILKITLNRKQYGIDRHINGFYVYYVQNSNYGNFDVFVNSKMVETIDCDGAKNKCARSEYIKVPSGVGNALKIEIVKNDAKTVAISGMSYIDNPNEVIVNNYSLSGFSVGQMEDELLKQLGKSNIVIFTLGYNDLSYGTDIEIFKNKLDILVDSCNKNSSLLIVGSVFWARNGNKNWADRYKQQLRQAAQNAKGYFIDFSTLPTDKVLDLNVDGGHPSISGHKLLGEKLCEFFGLKF